MAQKKIWLLLAEVGGREWEFIQEAFDTNRVVPLGPNVNGFEEDLTRYLGAPGKHVVALSADTAALHLGLVMLGVGRDDEVICQSFAFVVSTNPITYQGAKPIFVSSEPDTWNMSPTSLRQAIEDCIAQTGHKLKAIIPVHLYGMPAKVDEILVIAEEYDIPVLEDAAEALGSEYKGCKCGTLGRYGVLSFNGNKMITTSGGGALVCPSEETARRVLFYATQARDNTSHYQYTHISYNYRLSNISAGIGHGQMLVLGEHMAKRRHNHARYCALLADCPGVEMKCAPTEEYDSNYWFSCVLVDPEKTGFTREDLRPRLEAEAIESRPLWRSMRLWPVFVEAPRYVNNTNERLFSRGLCLPSGTLVTEENLQHIVAVIRELGKR